jgi:hypothetical protein
MNVEVVDFTKPVRHRHQGTFAVHTDGLIGDHCLVSTVFEMLLERHDAPMVIYSTYTPNPWPYRRGLKPEHLQEIADLAPRNRKRLDLVVDLLKELISANMIHGIYHFGRLFRDMDEMEKRYLWQMGCERVYDLSLISKQFIDMPKAMPYLGPEMRAEWERPKPHPLKIALFRWSAIHPHCTERLRPYNEWSRIERSLLECGMQPILFGYDDELPNDHGLLDFRKKLSVYGTLKAMAECAAMVTVTSFPPVFAQYYIPCLVLTDERDVSRQERIWKRTDRYEICPVKEGYQADLMRSLDKMISNL